MFHIILFAFYCDKYIIKTLIKKKLETFLGILTVKLLTGISKI